MEFEGRVMERCRGVVKIEELVTATVTEVSTVYTPKSQNCIIDGIGKTICLG